MNENTYKSIKWKFEFVKMHHVEIVNGKKLRLVVLISLFTT